MKNTKKKLIKVVFVKTIRKRDLKRFTYEAKILKNVELCTKMKKRTKK